MKLAIVSLFFMLYMLSDHFSEVEGAKGSPEKCTNPKMENRMDALEEKVDSVEEMFHAVEQQIAQIGQLSCQNDNTAPTSTVTTTTTPTLYTTTPTEGILMAAGRGYSRYVYLTQSTEVFIPDTGKTCSLPDIPESDTRVGHTLDTLGNTTVICGGTYRPYFSATSCQQFTPTSAGGVWTNYTTTMKRSHGHSSWVSSAGLVLMGGEYSGNTTEIVTSGGGNFSLVADTWNACAIADKDSTIITGGRYTMKVVARYNLQGHVENLPEMNQGRWYHGCGSYYSGGTMVLIIAGGKGAYYPLSSTEKLTAGATAWTIINPLPRTLSAMATVQLDNTIMLTGGHDGDYARTEILAFDGEDWKEVGQLQKPRYDHAATKIDMTNLMGFCN